MSEQKIGTSLENVDQRATAIELIEPRLKHLVKLAAEVAGKRRERSELLSWVNDLKTLLAADPAMASLRGETTEIRFDGKGQSYSLLIDATKIPKDGIPSSDTETIQSGLTITVKGNAEKSNSVPSSLDIESPSNRWEDLTQSIKAYDLNSPEIIEVVQKKLSQPENELVFRMMSLSELKEALTTGSIGGKAIEGQVESGVTWWGDSLGDSLNQRREKLYMNEAATWGGSNGMLVAVRRSAVEGSIIEKRKRLFADVNGTEYSAYKTKTKIPADAIVDIFRVSSGDINNFAKVEKLVL